MNLVERQAFSKEVASMVLLQVFVPMEKMGAALIVAHQKIDDQTKAIEALMGLVRDMALDQLPRRQPKPAPRASLTVVPLTRMTDATDDQA